jgi:hypothetical protein
VPATSYPHGQSVRFVATFYASANPSGAAINPASVFLTLRPLNLTASYVLGWGPASVAGSPGVVKVATGAFIVDFSPSVYGEWSGEWRGDVEGNAALNARDPFTFHVGDVV